MTGIIVTIPPTVELPPGSSGGGPVSLPPVTYQYAVLNIPQTWTAAQAFPAGTTGVTATVGNNSTLLATTAFVLANGGITNLTGDVTSVGPATTLATVNSNVGTFGSATSWPALTVNAKGLLTAVGIFTGRDKLTADRTYYASPTGSMANTGLTSGSPWTLQGAIDRIADTLDFGGFNITLDIWTAAGGVPYNFTTGILTNKMFIGANGAGSMKILGQPTATATVTITIASPGVISGISMATGQPFYLTTTGALPTNATKTTKFYALASGQFSLTSGGAAVNTTGTQSGTHTLTTTPAVSITTTSADAVNIGTQLAGNTQFTIGGVMLSTVTGGYCLTVTGGAAYVAFGTTGYPLDFGPCANSHVVSSHAANVFSGTFNIVSGSCGIGTGAGVHGSAASIGVLAFHNTGEIFLGAANSLSFPSGYWDCEDAGSNLFIDNMTSTNVNTPAVNTAYAWGLVSGGARIKNYPVTTTAFANGAVAVIGVGSSYATTGLEKDLLNQGGTGSDLSATGPGLLSQAGVGTNVTIVSPGQIPGEPTTGSASAGNVGEYAQSTLGYASRITLSNATGATITSVSLTAGDWDVVGTGYVETTGSPTGNSYNQVSVSGTNNTLSAVEGEYIYMPSLSTATDLANAVGPVRKSLSGTTTIYLVAASAFTGGTFKAWGQIRARRIR